jgi:fructose-bisphosphate aldolase class I
MSDPALASVAKALVGAGKGILAMDESPATCDGRLTEAGIAPSPAARRDYRDLLAGTPGLGDYVSGVILHDETIRQDTRDGVSFPEALARSGLTVGVKVDTGATALAGRCGERVTEGLDGLRDRLRAYHALGARFAKWRAVIAAGEGLPSDGCIEANAHALGRYAALCQEVGLVPIVEPEVLSAPAQTLEACRAVTEAVLEAVFDQLRAQGVVPEAMILKPNMVRPGEGGEGEADIDLAAEATVHSLARAAPAAVAGIAFLSGGQSGPMACARLDAMNRAAQAGALRAPWPLVFSFARAIQHPALRIWRGQDAQVGAARAALLHRARCAWAAMHGAYGHALEGEAS